MRGWAPAGAAYVANNVIDARAQDDKHLIAAVISDLGLLALERGDQDMAERLIG